MKLFYTSVFYLLLFVGAVCACSSDSDLTEEGEKPVPPEEEISVNELKLNSDKTNDVKVSVNNKGEFVLTTTGKDPYICTMPLDKKNPEKSVVLTFEYKASKTINGFQVFFANPLSGDRMEEYGTIEASPSKWNTYSCNLYDAIEKYSWGKIQDYFRLDFGSTVGVQLYMRNVRLRGMNSEEKEAWEAEQDRKNGIEKLTKELPEYLKRSFSSEITRVEVTSNKVNVAGRYSGSGTCSLAEVTPYEHALLLTNFKKCKTDIKAGEFTVSLDRVVEYDGYQYDRLLSKFVLVRTVNGKDELVSCGRYVDADLIDRSKASSLPDCSDNLTKGGEADRNSQAGWNDVDALGLKAVLVGIPVTAVMWETQANAAKKNDQVITHQYLGKNYYFSKSYFEEMDKGLLEFQKRNIAVFTVICIRPEVSKDANAYRNYDHDLGMLFQHPDFSEPAGTNGVYSMVNLDEAKSVNYWAAALDFMASRYSDGTHGRIHRYVLHNEIDDPSNWNNIGYKPLEYYVDYFTKSIRIGHNIIRQYNPHVQILVPVTQSWTREVIKPGIRAEYAVKKIFDLLNQLSAREGDFYWGMGYHSYPQKFNSRTWEDPDATFSMNTRMLTFKNLEVLDKWAKTPANMYKGAKQRNIWLTENGSSTSTYTEQSLKEQAACAAYALKKVEQLSGIQTLIWHALTDNDVEGNLNLGLHYRKDHPGDPWGKKPSWYVYQAYGTANESKVLDQYLPVIGVSKWEDIIHSVSD